MCHPEKNTDPVSGTAEGVDFSWSSIALQDILYFLEGNRCIFAMKIITHLVQIGSDWGGLERNSTAKYRLVLIGMSDVRSGQSRGGLS